MSDEPITNPPIVPATPPRRRNTLLRTVLALGVLVGGGVGGYALAMGGPGGFHGPWHGGWHDPAQRLERMQAMSRRALDGVGASADQENKIHDIIASAFTQVSKEGEATKEMRKRLVELLKVPTVDRAAVESLRAEMVRSIDARSKIVSNALLDASGQLQPEQRAKLADRMTAMMEHRRGVWGGWRHPGQDGPPRPSEKPGEEGPAGGPDRN